MTTVTATGKEDVKEDSVSWVSWSNFRKMFAQLSCYILFPGLNENRPQHAEAIIPSLYLNRAYKVGDVIITNGCATISVVPYEIDSQSPSMAVFYFSYEVTQLNISHLGKRQKNENFRVEVREKGYSIQVGSEDLKLN